MKKTSCGSKKKTSRKTKNIIRPGQGKMLLSTLKAAKPLRKALQLSGLINDCAQKVLDCIGEQSGSSDLSSDPAIGKVNVKGFELAGCINETFGLVPPDAFTEADFPPTMKVSGCIKLVCQVVGTQ